MPALELADIQGFVLRGYRLPLARHFVLTITSPAAARAALGKLVAGGNERPQITTAALWPAGKPDYCLNVGITWPGLLALGLERVADASFASFSSFVEGAAARAAVVGDVGVSAPEHWIGGLGSGKDHIILVLYAATPDTLASYSTSLDSVLLEGGGFEQLLRFDAAALPNEKVHFGYRDGISQPTIDGVPGRALPDAQPSSPAYNFVLLSDPDASYDLPAPEVIGKNGSFGVFRILRQDVVGFQKLLDDHREAIDPELLAAKLLGRWRNGVPLALSPDAPNGPVPDEALNCFDYVRSPAAPEAVDDTLGLRCPIGAHIRRTNPRGQSVVGRVPLHRIVRRGLPYGPPFVPGTDDRVERGLVGFFINASIREQYEFIMQTWVNEGGFADHLDPISRDPLGTTDRTKDNVFDIPRPAPAPALRIQGFSSFIQARGSAYCFLPSVTALRYLAAL